MTGDDRTREFRYGDLDARLEPGGGATQEPPKRSQSQLWLIVGGAGAVALILGVVLGLVLGGGSDGPEAGDGDFDASIPTFSVSFSPRVTDPRSLPRGSRWDIRRRSPGTQSEMVVEDVEVVDAEVIDQAGQPVVKVLFKLENAEDELRVREVETATQLFLVRRGPGGEPTTTSPPETTTPETTPPETTPPEPPPPADPATPPPSG